MSLYMDNRVFNVNGKNEDMLLRVLSLAFEQEGCKTCKAWAFSKKHGLVLLWYKSDRTEEQSFPSGLTAAQCLPFVVAWLQSDEAATVDMSGWDADATHDGSNSLGWRVYCEDWGHVGNFTNSICAVKPAFLWHGK